MKYELNMMDYLKWIKKERFIADSYPTLTNKVVKYNKIMAKMKFNDSQPKLGDFVACNEAGEVMEEPEEGQFKKYIEPKPYEERVNEYQSALDRRLWKGWEIKEHPEYGKMLYDGEHYYADGALFNKGDTYDELITSGVELERIQKTNGQSR